MEAREENKQKLSLVSKWLDRKDKILINTMKREEMTVTRLKNKVIIFSPLKFIDLTLGYELER